MSKKKKLKQIRKLLPCEGHFREVALKKQIKEMTKNFYKMDRIASQNQAKVWTLQKENKELIDISNKVIILKEGLKHLLKFSEHYALLLNDYDGGKRKPSKILIDIGINPDTLKIEKDHDL